MSDPLLYTVTWINVRNNNVEFKKPQKNAYVSAPCI